MPLHESSRVNWRASILPGQTRDLLEQVQTIYGDSFHSTLWQIGVADGRMRMMNSDEHHLNRSRELTRRSEAPSSVKLMATWTRDQVQE
jgi:hypothetical protein